MSRLEYEREKDFYEYEEDNNRELYYSIDCNDVVLYGLYEDLEWAEKMLGEY